MSSARRAYFAFVTTCIVSGTTYLAIRIALETIPPMLMAAARWIVAGTFLVAVLALQGVKLPSSRQWPTLTALGILLLGFGNGAVVWAEQTVPSGLTAVLVATVPFWMVGIDAFARQKDDAAAGTGLNARTVTGLIVGFLGIVLLVWPELQVESGRGFLVGVVSTQLACLGPGWSAPASRNRRECSDATRPRCPRRSAAYPPGRSLEKNIQCSSRENAG